MVTLAVLCVLASAAMCYLIGYAVIAPRDSWLHTKRGILILVVGGLSIVTLPPQLPALGSASKMFEGVLPGLTLEWPAGLPAGAYMALWLITSLAALFAGMRIWRAGKPGWRAGTSGSAYDSSASARAAGIMAMANGLDDIFDALRRTSVDAKGVDRIAEELRTAGRRFAGELPAESGAAYRLVASKVPAPIASGVTRYLLEGAGRGGQIANVTGR